LITVILNSVGHQFDKKSLYRDINATFSTGINGIAGPNGSGKSTLLQICTGLLTPSRGEVLWKKDETVLERFEVRRHLGFAAPVASYYDDLTVEENLFFAYRVHGLSKTECEASLERWNLTGLRGLLYKKLSSGQQQRVKLAAAFHPRAALLILDEPATNLDVANTGLLHENICNAGETATVILASNDPADLALANTILTINS
jgi:ABC-type multidrug transport system ATPase subunit